MSGGVAGACDLISVSFRCLKHRRMLVGVKQKVTELRKLLHCLIALIPAIWLPYFKRLSSRFWKRLLLRSFSWICYL